MHANPVGTSRNKWIFNQSSRVDASNLKVYRAVKLLLLELEIYIYFYIYMYIYNKGSTTMPHRYIMTFSLFTYLRLFHFATERNSLNFSGNKKRQEIKINAWLTTPNVVGHGLHFARLDSVKESSRNAFIFRGTHFFYLSRDLIPSSGYISALFNEPLKINAN